MICIDLFRIPLRISSLHIDQYIFCSYRINDFCSKCHQNKTQLRVLGLIISVQLMFMVFWLLLQVQDLKLQIGYQVYDKMFHNKIRYSFLCKQNRPNQILVFFYRIQYHRILIKVRNNVKLDSYLNSVDKLDTLFFVDYYHDFVFP